LDQIELKVLRHKEILSRIDSKNDGIFEIHIYTFVNAKKPTKRQVPFNVILVTTRLTVS